MDIVERGEEKSGVGSEGGGYRVGDSGRVGRDGEREWYIGGVEVLVYVERVERDDKGMWDKEVNMI